MLAGGLLCCLVPRRVGARLLAGGAVVAFLSAAGIVPAAAVWPSVWDYVSRLLVGGAPSPPYHEGGSLPWLQLFGVSAGLMAVATMLFCLVLRAVARYRGAPRLGREFVFFAFLTYAFLAVVFIMQFNIEARWASGFADHSSYVAFLDFASQVELAFVGAGLLLGTYLLALLWRLRRHLPAPREGVNQD
jgi:hypothetical protein